MMTITDAARAAESDVADELAAALLDMWDFQCDPVSGASFPTHAADDGYRGSNSHVQLQPADVQARLRENAQRILAWVEQRYARRGAQPAGGAEPMALYDRLHIESMTREWFAGPEPTIDGYLEVLKRRLARIWPVLEQGSDGARIVAWQQEMAARRGAPPPQPDPDDGWRDIASAPKDGKPLLLRYDKINYKGANVAEWNGIRWYTGFGGAGYLLGEPTHWRSIPPPPAQPAEPARGDEPAHLAFTPSPETLVEIERLKAEYGVSTNTEVLQRFVSNMQASQEGGDATCQNTNQQTCNQAPATDERAGAVSETIAVVQRFEKVWEDAGHDARVHYDARTKSLAMAEACRSLLPALEAAARVRPVSAEAEAIASLRKEWTYRMSSYPDDPNRARLAMLDEVEAAIRARTAPAQEGRR